ncbi:MAG: hypothetical protein Q7V20_03470 [Aquabacterium sp.]|uniref:hypothetical protein n=1 Tax=Aquabacterium sp. TaxID=1872578 RepID=UPI0027258C14|nr:hypothetical protein [Aquabacterium sp.]MDO9002501.1 hypothetical protein [Aquabacterium sp.]
MTFSIADVLLGARTTAGGAAVDTWCALRLVDKVAMVERVRKMTAAQRAALAYSAALSRSSIVRYTGALKGYELWCHAEGLTGFPITTDVLVAYLMHYVVLKGLASQSIDGIVTGIKRALELSGNGHYCLSVGDELLVRDALKGIKRIEAEGGVKHDNRRAPILFSHLVDILAASLLLVESLAAAVAAQQVLCMFLAHSGMLRVGEYMDGALELQHISFHSVDGSTVRPTKSVWRPRVAYAVLVLMRNKGSADRKGETAVIPKQPVPVDALLLLLAYYERFLLQRRPGDEPLFCHLELQAGVVVRVPSRVLSDSYLNRSITHWLSAAGYVPNRHSSHSLRVGGCTDSHCNGVAEAAILRNGRWHDVGTMTKYNRSDPRDAASLTYDPALAAQRLEYAAAAKAGQVSVAAALDAYADEDAGPLLDGLLVEEGETLPSASASEEGETLPPASAGAGAPAVTPPVVGVSASPREVVGPTTTPAHSPPAPAALHRVTAPRLAPAASGASSTAAVRAPSSRVGRGLRKPTNTD